MEIQLWPFFYYCTPCPYTILITLDHSTVLLALLYVLLTPDNNLTLLDSYALP
jgi:hypothetical protein